MGLFSSKLIRTITAVFLVLGGLWLITANTGNGLFVSVVNTITYPFRLSSWGSASTSADGKSADELEKENETLKKELTAANTKLADYYNIKRENAQLRKYYNLKTENTDFQLMPAYVISRDPSESFYSFTADKGSSSGVEVFDAVLTENGLIGFVSHVDITSCTVTTILSPDTKISAVDSVTNDTGIIKGRAALADKNKTTLTVLSSENEIAPGDIVTTSGMGGYYPPGIIIGKVEEIKYDDFDVSQYAVIAPLEDIKELTDIVIITEYDEAENGGD